ncbi:MAG: exonuclease domain-containing protein, partial [Kiloniellaceae bacterium]
MSFHSVEGAGLSGLPLHAIPVVALDTETTGLDVKTDRVVEIAAVRLKGGIPGAAPNYTALVDPGVPIPPASTAIHSLTDDDVAGAAAFPQAMAAFADWVGRSVVVGYSIGFDLAVLKAEHQRHGVPWTAPRSLCVRHLLQLVAPHLPGQSLEVAAQWLGVEAGERHRALGDAETAGRIFKALLPRLREKGIVTLAQAERVCRSLTARLEEEAQAGWHDVVRDTRQAPRSVAEFARIDSFPYRHRVADLMHLPAVTIAGTRSLQEALAQMIERGISSVFVEPAEAGPDAPGDASGGASGNAPRDALGDWGILTERDILRAVNADPAGALAAPVARYAKVPLVTIESDEFVYRAIAGMSKRGFRHLGVRDASGKLVGALSARDLLRQRASDALSLGDSLEQAETPEDLGRIWAGLTTVARGLVYEEADPRDIAAIVSRELRALTKRACELAEAILAARGEGT